MITSVPTIPVLLCDNSFCLRMHIRIYIIYAENSQSLALMCSLITSLISGRNMLIRRWGQKICTRAQVSGLSCGKVGNYNVGQPQCVTGCPNWILVTHFEIHFNVGHPLCDCMVVPILMLANPIDPFQCQSSPVYCMVATPSTRFKCRSSPVWLHGCPNCNVGQPHRPISMSVIPCLLHGCPNFNVGRPHWPVGQLLQCGWLALMLAGQLVTHWSTTALWLVYSSPTGLGVNDPFHCWPTASLSGYWPSLCSVYVWTSRHVHSNYRFDHFP